MDVNVAKKYLRQHIELFGDEIYAIIDDNYIKECTNLDHSQKNLDSLESSIKNCEKCNLSLTRNKFVFGSGDPNADLFLIGEGSILFNDNSFYLDDKFNFKSINFYAESDSQICSYGLLHYLNNYKNSNVIIKKQGLFEKFFNYFSK